MNCLEIPTNAWEVSTSSVSGSPATFSNSTSSVSTERSMIV